MMASDPQACILIWSPLGRDAAVAQAILAEVGIASAICDTMDDLLAGLEIACGAIVAQEALLSADRHALAQRLKSQPPWSDFPFVLLASRSAQADPRLLDLLGKVTVLERPVHPVTLAMAARSAIRARLRQFQAGAQMEAQQRTQAALAEETRTLATLNRLGATLAAELDLDKLVQIITDAGVEVTGAAFGAFFYNVIDDQGEHYTLYTLSGAPHDAFGEFPMPRNTAVFGPTFRGEAVLRSDDILQDERYGRNEPFRGMPQGHLPVRSYLAAPVVSRSGEVLGGLFFGHPEPGVFTDRAERLIQGIAAQAAIAIDNSQLYQAAQRELAERRQVEAALRASEARLEDIVAERTAALAREMAERQEAEAALLRAQKMEAVGQLTGGIAHDFNNLLTAIVGGLELVIKRATLDERTSRLLENARHAADRGAKLTQQLLAFSRKQRLEPQPVDVDGLIEGLTPMLQSTIGALVRIDLKLHARLRPAMVDPTQLEMVILNLAINARDAMPQGGELTIETHQVDRLPPTSAGEAAGSYVEIAVRDTGSGMPEDVLAKVFDPFFTTKPLGKGTGLGLSQVYGFAKQSGGDIAIDSQVGQGTTVRVFLPCTERRDSAEPVSQTAVALPQGARVLLVDDDATVRVLGEALLEELRCEVVAVDSAAAALSVLENGHEIDLLLADVAMPEMNGLELAQAALRINPSIAVLFTTGYSDIGALGDALADEDVLRKPYSLHELAAKLSRALSQALTD